MAGAGFKCNQCGEIDIWRWPWLGAAFFSMLTLLLGGLAVYALGLHSLGGMYLCALMLLSIGLCCKYAIDLTLLDKKIKAYEDRKKDREQKTGSS